MNITLFPDQEKLIAEKVHSGEYQSATDVLSAALQAIEERDQALGRIRTQIDEGFAQAERGELFDGDEVFQEIRRRGNERRSHGPRPAFA